MKDGKPYTFHLPIPLLAWLREEAARRYTTVSALLREAIVLLKERDEHRD